MKLSHQYAGLQVLGANARAVRLQGALRLQADRAGWLWVEHGRVWITRGGEGVDHVLAAPQALYLARGDDLVAESWRPQEVAGLRWAQAAEAQAFLRGRPRDAAGTAAALPAAGRPSPRGARGLALALTGALASARATLAGRLGAAARSADSSARRAQGCISAGDSIASSGALQ